MAGFPVLDAPLSDGVASLRMAAERDIPEVLIAYQDDSQLHRRLAEERPPSGAELGRRAERSDADRAAGTQLVLSVVEPGGDTCRGEIRISEVDWEHRRAEVCLWVAPEHRGRGLGSHALGLAADWLLQTSGLSRLALECETNNPAAQRTAQAAGFRPEGVLRGRRRGNGRRIDVTVLARTRPHLER